MEFNVAQLLQEPVGARRAFQVCEACLSDDDVAVDLDGRVQLLRTDAGVLVTAELETTVDAACSRCLKELRVPLGLVIEEEYYPTADVQTGAPLPPPDEPTAFLIDGHHILDLCEAVRQQLVLAEPMQPLCQPNCAGLCSACGADLNAGSCACPPVDADVRWAALLEIAKSSQA